jgi:hypothetical protein
VAGKPFFTPERVRRYPAATAIVLFVVGVAVVVRDGPHAVLGGDFRAFYTAGALLARGSPELLYDASAQQAFQHSVLGVARETHSVWMSPPWAAWLFVPFSRLPFWLAYGTFTFLGLLLAWKALSMLRAELALEPSPGRLATLLLQYFPVLASLCIGQTTALWFFVSAAFVIALRSGREVQAGLLLALLVFKPQLALGFGAVLLGARRFRLMAIAAAVAGGVVLASELLTPGALARYLAASGSLAEALRAPDYPSAGLHGGAEVSFLLLAGVSPAAAAALGFAISALLTFAIVRMWWGRRFEPGTQSFDLRLAASLALGLVASPHLYLYDLALLGVPILLAHSSFSKVHEPAARALSSPRLPLDADSVFRAVAGVWALGLAGPAFTVVQQQLSRRLFGFSVALQLGALAVVYLAFTLWRASGTAKSAVVREVHAPR